MIMHNMGVRVLHHNDCGVHHSPNRNRNTSKRHDISVNALQLHNKQSRKNRRRECENSNERTSDVKQEAYNYQRYNNTFFQ